MSILDIQTPRAFLPLLQPARYKGAKGGRGSGKSHFFGELHVEEAITQHIRCACLRETQVSIKDSVKQLIEDKIRKLNVGHLFRVTETEIRGPNDSLFIFKGLQNHTAASIKSLEGFNRAWVEEAQTISQRSLDLAIPTFRMPGAEMRFSWNPNKPTDPVERLFTENEGDPDFICVTANYSDNPWFWETSLAADMERDRRRDPDKYAHIWGGGYQTSSEARVFRNWRVEAFETPSDAVFRFGADWGFGTDPSVLVRGFIQGRTLFIDHCVSEAGVETDLLPFLFGGTEDEALNARNAQAHRALTEAQKAQWTGIPGSTRWTITADSARPETVSYMRRHGFKIVAAIKGQGSLEDGVEFLKSFDIVVHPRCQAVEHELTHYSYKTDPLTGEVLPVLEDKDNHTIDALRYALEALRRSGKKAPPPPPKKPRDAYAITQDSEESWKTA
ncbi:PBSX family phage terminase large subunit [Brevundimonas diminuta]|uniref:PBSX family phage terminase large subunit n=1 Tax=Brevundimonas diminuta TaxID=293 RepID=UPI0025A5EE34|nr:PBSX family phage terminase large subunit [Brevundimonas diminuta]MDM8352891.1 PBSX family phage terminase large subunit [Brevundimonas diminuta]